MFRTGQQKNVTLLCMGHPPPVGRNGEMCFSCKNSWRIILSWAEIKKKREENGRLCAVHPNIPEVWFSASCFPLCAVFCAKAFRYLSPESFAFFVSLFEPLPLFLFSFLFSKSVCLSFFLLFFLIHSLLDFFLFFMPFPFRWVWVVFCLLFFVCFLSYHAKLWLQLNLQALQCAP